MEYGLQMYSVRDITGRDLKGALKQVADIGYRYVEFAGFFGNQAADVKRWLDEFGLIASGTHTGIDPLLNDYEGTVRYHKEIGCSSIIIPGADLSCQAKLDAFVANVNRLIPKLADEGITLGYHNHGHEFRANRDGSMIHEQLVYRTDLRFEIDTFWYYDQTGISAKGILERLKDRIDCIHIKDGFRRGAGMPLGCGDAPVKEAYDTAKALGMLMVVESESLKPDGVSEARECFKYLRKQEND
ncbi:MAG: sugar phosphate isomerase/epimerase [Clostridia bacterium]|nr:sugar phosphate isomerase/epimerase [Clostridia bacterium]MBR6498186.1 sugar phosphate isomerase/epimerase [Clostridia bacterium]